MPQDNSHQLSEVRSCADLQARTELLGFWCTCRAHQQRQSAWGPNQARQSSLRRMPGCCTRCYVQLWTAATQTHSYNSTPELVAVRRTSRNKMARHPARKPLVAQLKLTPSMHTVPSSNYIIPSTSGRLPRLTAVGTRVSKGASHVYVDQGSSNQHIIPTSCPTRQLKLSMSAQKRCAPAATCKELRDRPGAETYRDSGNNS